MTKADEYIRQLQQACYVEQRRHLLTEDEKHAEFQRAKEMMNPADAAKLKYEDFARAMYDPNLVGEFGGIDLLKDHLIPAMQSSALDLKTIPVGFLPINIFNAVALRVPGGECAIALNEALSGVLTAVSRIMVAFAMSDPSRMTSHLGDVDWFLRSIGTLALYVANPGSVEIPSGFAPDLPDLRSRTVWEIYFTQMQYILAHEYAHIILGHLNPNNLVRHALGPRADQNVEFYRKRQQDEKQADDIAFTAIQGVKVFLSPKPAAESLSKVGLMFSFMSLCEKAGMGPSPDESTHPSANERFFRVRDLLKSCGGQQDLLLIDRTAELVGSIQFV